ncbi:MAG: preprotein translocase subunit YajC [Nocardioidaceae bacterium]
MNQLVQLLPLVAIAALFYLLVLRPARARQRKVAEVQSELEVGATIMLTSGVFGRVSRTGDESIALQVGRDVTLTVHRNAVGRLLDDEERVRLAADGPLGWDPH